MKNQWIRSSFLKRPSSTPIKFSVFSILFLLIGLFVGANFLTVNPRISVDGEVILLSGEKEVLSPKDGLMIDFDKKVGTQVKKDEVLGKIKFLNTTESELQSLLAGLHQFLENQKVNIQSLAKFPEQSSKEPEIQKLLAQASLDWEKYLVNQTEARQIISKKVASVDQKKQALNKKLQILLNSPQKKLLLSTIEDLQNAVQTLAQESASLQADSLAKISVSRRLAISQIKNSYLWILDFYQAHLIRSPIDGLLAKINIHSYQEVKKSQSLFSIIPQPANFGIRLHVPSQYLSKVEAKSPLKISIDAYPYQKYGYFEGEVTSLDQIISSQKMAFEVQGSLTNPSLRAPASEIHLYPGMKAKVFVMSREMSFLNYLFERLFTDEN